MRQFIETRGCFRGIKRDGVDFGDGGVIAIYDVGSTVYLSPPRIKALLQVRHGASLDDIYWGLRIYTEAILCGAVAMPAVVPRMTAPSASKRDLRRCKCVFRDGADARASCRAIRCRSIGDKPPI